MVDIGAGVGGPARVLAHHFGCQVTAYEYNRDMVGAGEWANDPLPGGAKYEDNDGPVGLTDRSSLSTRRDLEPFGVARTQQGALCGRKFLQGHW